MGLGNVVLPMPVKLDLYIGEPVIPRSKESAVEFAKRVNLATQALMDSVREKHSNDKNIHSVREMFVRYPAYVMYTIIQNVTMWSTVVFLNVLLVPIILFIQLLFRAFLTTTRGKSHDDENNEKKHN